MGTRWLCVVWGTIFISFCTGLFVDSLILICKHLPPLSSLNSAKGLKSLAVFKSEIGQGFRGLWEGLGPVKCLVTGPHMLQLMQWEETPWPSPPGHYCNCAPWSPSQGWAVTLESAWSYKKSPRINEIRTRSCTADAFGFLVMRAAL